MSIKKLIVAGWMTLCMITFLTGCLEPVEINKLGIVSGLAVDQTDDGYIVTAQILNPAAISGKTTNALPVYSLKAEGTSIHEAYKKLDDMQSAALSLSHLNVMVINEAFAEAGFAPLLNFSLRRFDVRPDISIVVAKDAAASDILNVITALDLIPANQINISNRVPSRTERLTSYNLYETVDMVNTNTINTVLNAVTLHREQTQLDEDHQLEAGMGNQATQNGSTLNNILDITVPVQLRFEHLAVFQGDKLVGFMNDAEAQLYNMVLGDFKRYDIVTKIEEDYYTSFGVTKIDSKITTDLAQNEATLQLSLSGLIFENTYPIDLTNQENLVVISEHLKSSLAQDMTDFVNKVQTELKSDIFGIGGKAYYQEHHVWKEKEGYWSELFPELTLNIEIELEVNSVGEIGNVTL
ncbi:MAG: Ger(x)C family spore germination protein [Defluviitaleaceae bacterium]|nr:Ger(x)C family spore germination protein [Defluviitaleaceae bacterium]